MSTVWLVARRECTTRVRTKAFRVGTAVMIAVLIGWVLLQIFLVDAADRRTVGVTASASGISAPLVATAEALGRTVEIRPIADESAGVEQVRGGDLDALITGTPGAPRVVVKDSLDTTLRGALDVLVRQQARATALTALGVNPTEVEQAAAAARIDVQALRPEDPGQPRRLALALVTAFVLYLSLVFFGSAVAQGVVEEKSSRVVEILLATVRPWQLLVGKVLGVGAVGLLQLVLVGAVGIGVAALGGVLPDGTVAVGTLGVAVLWFLLGYLLYAVVLAAAGSLVSRQEDVQSTVTPVITVVALGFAVGFSLLARSPDDDTAAVLSMLPPFAPMLMPARMALGTAPAWQVGVAVALILASIAVVTWLGGRVYHNSVLRTGGRVRLRDAVSSR